MFIYFYHLYVFIPGFVLALLERILPPIPIQRLRFSYVNFIFSECEISKSLCSVFSFSCFNSAVLFSENNLCYIFAFGSIFVFFCLLAFSIILIFFFFQQTSNGPPVRCYVISNLLSDDLATYT